MTRGPIAIAMFALVAGCATESTPWESSIGPEDVAAATPYGGLAPSEDRITTRLESGRVAFRFAERELATVTFPESWQWRVVHGFSTSNRGRMYHWATLVWETKDGRPARVRLRYVGEEALFLEIDGAEQLIEPGAEFVLGA